MDSKTIKNLKFAVPLEAQYFNPEEIAKRYCTGAEGECAELVRKLYRKEYDREDEF
ncbi:MAG: hypothetical protein QXF41_02815 [Candidatus Micrarchaeaceae archaeon]